jgi:hypothetical protein
VFGELTLAQVSLSFMSCLRNRKIYTHGFQNVDGCIKSRDETEGDALDIAVCKGPIS